MFRSESLLSKPEDSGRSARFLKRSIYSWASFNWEKGSHGQCWQTEVPWITFIIEKLVKWGRQTQHPKCLTVSYIYDNKQFTPLRVRPRFSSVFIFEIPSVHFDVIGGHSSGLWVERQDLSRTSNHWLDHLHCQSISRSNELPVGIIFLWQQTQTFKQSKFIHSEYTLHYWHVNPKECY